MPRRHYFNTSALLLLISLSAAFTLDWQNSPSPGSQELPARYPASPREKTRDFSEDFATGCCASITTHACNISYWLSKTLLIYAPRRRTDADCRAALR
jgi:hypothetical protein